MYNFKSLVKRYSKYFPIEYHKVVNTEIDMSQGGKVTEVIEKIPIEGAIAGKEETVVYDNGGFGKEYVLKLYTYNQLDEGSTIVVEDTKQYTVHIARDYSRFDKGLYIYRLESGTDG